MLLNTDLREHLQAALGSSYTIERELGGGGMSRVFAATDTALGRRVVIKVLPPELAAEVSAARFRREVQVVAGLQDPHIVPVLSAGDASGVLYFVMPFIEGESLRARLSRVGELTIGDATAVLRDVLKALAHAHRRGVVHRDLKPENVLLSERDALVADFGIAKAITAAAPSEGFTSVGMALGTPAYMSPEQAVGDPAVDQRADLYAVGVIAYEMLTGSPPFAGRPPQAMLAAHATETPEQVNARRPAVPQPLASCVMRLLAKRPADRPQSAEDVLRELETVSTPIPGSTTSTQHPSAVVPPAVERATSTAIGRRRWGLLAGALAGVGLVTGTVLLTGHRRAPVLEPKRVVIATFQNRTGDRSLDALGAMTADWVARGLAATGLVDVAGTAAELAARSGSTSAESSNVASNQALAEEARAGLVISGAFYRQGDRLLFEAAFTDAREGKLVQSVGPVEAPVSAPLDGVERLRQRVTGSLAALVDPALAEMVGMTSQPPSYEAYSEFLAGEDLFYSQDSVAIEHYFRAAALDSTYLFPLLRASMALGNRGEFRREDSLVTVLEAKRSRLSPFEGYLLDNNRAMLAHDEPGTLAATNAMLRVAPKSEYAAYLKASSLERVGRPREALSVLESLDPRSGALRGRIFYYEYVTYALHMLGEHERELQAALKGERQYPDRLYMVAMQASALAAMGRTAELDSCIARALLLPPDVDDVTPATVLTALVYELRAHDHPDAAERVGKRALVVLQSRSPGESGSPGGRRELARAFAATHKWAELRALTDSLTRERPTDVEMLGYSGVAAAELGDTATARRIEGSFRTNGLAYAEDRALDSPARVAAARGDKVAAMNWLRRLHPNGSLPENGIWHDDLLFELLADYQPFREYLKPKG